MLGQWAAILKGSASRHSRALAETRNGISGRLHGTPHAQFAADDPAYSTSSNETYDTIKVEVEDAAGKIIISRPKALNAVSSKVWQH